MDNSKKLQIDDLLVFTFKAKLQKIKWVYFYFFFTQTLKVSDIFLVYYKLL